MWPTRGTDAGYGLFWFEICPGERENTYLFAANKLDQGPIGRSANELEGTWKDAVMA
jgi:hypothetical protein